MWLRVFEKTRFCHFFCGKHCRMMIFFPLANRGKKIMVVSDYAVKFGSDFIKIAYNFFESSLLKIK